MPGRNAKKMLEPLEARSFLVQVFQSRRSMPPSPRIEQIHSKQSFSHYSYQLTHFTGPPVHLCCHMSSTKLPNILKYSLPLLVEVRSVQSSIIVCFILSHLKASRREIVQERKEGGRGVCVCSSIHLFISMVTLQKQIPKFVGLPTQFSRSSSKMAWIRRTEAVEEKNDSDASVWQFRCLCMAALYGRDIWTVA